MLGPIGGGMRKLARGFGVASMLLFVGASCQPPVQQVPLHLTPSDARVFVDGSELAPGTASVELRSDRPHVVLARRDGYLPAQVVLESRSSAGGTTLEPAELRIELQPVVPKERSLRIEGVD